MALWPNNFSDIRGRFPSLLSGSPAFDMSAQRLTRSLAFFANGAISPTASIPEGAFQSPVCILAPLIGGAMSAGNSTRDITVASTGALVAGGAIAGTATITVESTASMSLVVSLSGEAVATITTADATLSLTIGLSGEATWSFTPAGALSLLVPISGTAPITVTGTADLKGLLSMSGESTPFTELSPQALAAAVWSSLATANNTAGSMGEKLNDAGSASNPWTEVIESGYTAAEIMRLLAAVMAGKSSGGGGASITFRDLADTKARITATVDSNGNRTALTTDVTP